MQSGRAKKCSKDDDTHSVVDANFTRTYSETDAIAATRNITSSKTRCKD